MVFFSSSFLSRVVIHFQIFFFNSRWLKDCKKKNASGWLCPGFFFVLGVVVLWEKTDLRVVGVEHFAALGWGMLFSGIALMNRL